MQDRYAIIVSESSLLSSALEANLRGMCSQVKRVGRIEDVSIDEGWPRSVLVVETSEPAQTVRALMELRDHGDLSRTVLLLRANQRLEEFAILMGEVGAILPNTCTMAEVGLAIGIVREGLALVPSEMLRDIREALADVAPAVAEFAHLTEQEDRVLSLIAEGCSNKMIARRLGISDGTVRVHVRSLLKKLGVQNRTQAALLAMSRRTAPREQSDLEGKSRRTASEPVDLFSRTRKRIG